MAQILLVMWRCPPGSLNEVMVNRVKYKFASLLRGVLRQLDDPGHTALPPEHAAAPVTNPSAPAPAPAAPANQFTPAPRVANENEIEIPLPAVVAALPMDLRGKLMPMPTAGMTIVLPVETVLSQLAFGAVKISFGELREMTPGLFANSGGEMDNRPVSLPLKEILARLNPALLTRRGGAKMEVADNIVGPFGGRGQGITFTTQPLKAPTPPKTLPTPAPPAPETVAPSLRFSEPVKPIAFTPPTPVRQMPPPASHGNGHSIPLSVSGQRPPVSNSPTPPPVKLFVAPAPAPVPAPVEVTSPRPEPALPTIFASLCDLSENWPEELQNEILRGPLANASVPLAGSLIEPGLKRGRVTMSWKQLRLLTKPSSPPSPNDHLELDLPLKILAPLYFAAQKNVLKPQKKPVVSADIPDLFFGFPQAAPATPETKPADTNYFVRSDNTVEPKTEERAVEAPAVPQTDFTHRQAQPKEVVARAAGLPGVAGALVALPDGLRVASQVPADLNADTLAAFLPQIFERVNQSTRELRMGALNNVNFTVGNVPWKIFRVSSVYFAAFGRAGESLPSAQLAQLAAELDRKKSQ